MLEKLSDEPESSSEEIDADKFDLEHKCPKCGFEFNDN
jgi:predicted Zn-ribbon and HTH transcriptional regulator